MNRDPLHQSVSHMTKEEAAARLSTEVYKACDIIERLEGAGLILGNGHHIRQSIAAHAVKLLQERWQDPKSSTTSA